MMEKDGDTDTDTDGVPVVYTSSVSASGVPLLTASAFSSCAQPMFVSINIAVDTRIQSIGHRRNIVCWQD